METFHKILLTGASGQLGKAFRQMLPTENLTCTDLKGMNLVLCDLTDSAAMDELLHRVQPDLIINTAAFTSTELAEMSPCEAKAVNADAPEALALWAKAHGSHMIHFSTDYVYDGTGCAPWTEHSPTKPVSEYGKTKLAGDLAVLRTGVKGAIFRSSWLYSPIGQNFAKTILQLATEQEELSVVADQIGVPTSADFLAQMSLVALLKPDALRLCEIFHVVPHGELTWHAFAEAIVESARKFGYPIKAKRIIPISSADYPTRVLRPLNSRLDCARFENAFGIKLADWRTGFDQVMSQLVGPHNS